MRALALNIPALDGLAPWRVKAAYVCLLLFPAAGLLIRHWTSTLFVVLALVLGAMRSFRGIPALAREEKWLLAAFALYFVSFFLSAAVNEAWPQFIDRLGVELRFLLFIPLYLLMRELPNAYEWLMAGCLVGAVAGLAQAAYEAWWLALPVVAGAYGNQIVVGSVHALFAVLLLDRALAPRSGGVAVSWPFLCAALASALVVLLAGSRGGYLALAGLLVVWALLRLPPRKTLLFVAGLAACAVLVYGAIDRVRDRVDEAVRDVVLYTEIDQTTDSPDTLPSQGQRLEMWKAAWMMFKENPVLGVGRHRYTEVAEGYARAGLVHPDAAAHAHPHNAYLEMAASKGAVGLGVFLAMLFGPLAILLRERKPLSLPAAAGTILIAGFALFSLTESAPFLKGSFIALFLVPLAVFVSECRRIQSAAVTPGAKPAL